MNIKDYKCKCGHDDFFLAYKGNNQIGIYCSNCGKWLKWANKDEQNLRMNQKSVLDKIRAEIEDLRFGQPLRKLVVDECLEIIDKYRAEREDK